MNNDKFYGLLIAGVVFLLLVLAAAGLYLVPQYHIYQQRAAGRADLAQAESSKKIAIETARAKSEAAKLEAEAEVERAKGVAEANRIIGKSLEGNESYLRYLWITGIDGENDKTVVYIPTEAGLPILEAQRLGRQGEQKEAGK